MCVCVIRDFHAYAKINTPSSKRKRNFIQTSHLDFRVALQSLSHSCVGDEGYILCTHEVYFLTLQMFLELW